MVGASTYFTTAGCRLLCDSRDDWGLVRLLDSCPDIGEPISSLSPQCDPRLPSPTDLSDLSYQQPIDRPNGGEEMSSRVAREREDLLH